MNTYILKNLAKHIASQGGLKRSEAKKLLELLSPADLRKLNQMLLLEQEKVTAYVTTADELSVKGMEEVKAAFPNKRIVASVNKKIGAGLHAQVYDMIYDLTVKSNITRITKKLEEEL